MRKTACYFREKLYESLQTTVTLCGLQMVKLAVENGWTGSDENRSFLNFFECRVFGVNYVCITTMVFIATIHYSYIC